MTLPDFVFEAGGPLPPGKDWPDLPDSIVLHLAALGDQRAVDELLARAS